MNQSAKPSRTAPRRIAGRLALVCGLLLVLPSCGIPGLRKADPGPALPETFNGVTSGDNNAQLRVDEFFDDPILQSLIQQALVGNQELKILAQDIQIANNEVLGRTGAYLPFLSLGAGAGIDKPSLYTRSGAVDNQLNIVPFSPFPSPLPDFLFAANVSWQIDIWRQLRNARDASALRFLGTAEGRNYTVTRLVAEIADNYYELIALDKRLENLNFTIQLQKQSLQVAIANKNAARGTELAVQRFVAEVAKNESEKLIINQRIIEAENRINFLVGRYPQPVERRSDVDFFDLNIHTLSVGVPSQLLQNRPDIRQAERELQATGLDIRSARARFFPALTITGTVGYEAFNPRYLVITPEALIGNVAGQLVAPLINRRLIQAEYKNATARQLQAVYNYQRVVLNAFTEVINRLAMEENYRNSIKIKRDQLKALEASVAAASRLFQAARAEYMDVLFAQRDLMDARMNTIETKKQQLSAIIYTYQALGGGGYLLPILEPTPVETRHGLIHRLFKAPGNVPVPPPPPVYPNPVLPAAVAPNGAEPLITSPAARPAIPTNNAPQGMMPSSPPPAGLSPVAPPPPAPPGPVPPPTDPGPQPPVIEPVPGVPRPN